MVSTRNHPSNFPPPTDSPSKVPARSARDFDSPSPVPTSSVSKAKTKPRDKQASSGKSEVWTHTPSNLALIWLLISLPLVFWDTGYVLLRPWSMPGGFLHSPIWTPYELYGRVDYIYGWPAVEANNGFTSAQGVMNLVESAGYMVYLWVVWKYGSPTENTEGRGAPSTKLVGWLGEARSVNGSPAGLAVLTAYSAATLTVSKTVLYWLNEYFSGFANIRHNDALSLIFLWIIPNGAWLVFPSYIIYILGQEILEAMAIASGGSGNTFSHRKTLAIKDE